MYHQSVKKPLRSNATIPKKKPQPLADMQRFRLLPRMLSLKKQDSCLKMALEEQQNKFKNC